MAQAQILKQIPSYWGLYQGCDPEVFITRVAGKLNTRTSVLASEVLIPEEGFVAKDQNGSRIGSIKRDGVQIELHPVHSGCRQSLSYNIANSIWNLQKLVADAQLKYPGLKIDLSPVVHLSKSDLMRMSPDCRRLGCTPSFNAYGRPHIEKDGEKFLTRSAAGHLHLGSDMFKHLDDKEFAVKILDLIVGNTCVMIDRHPLAAERRKVYGKAGEYRLPAHGLEYRTLSNFWLHDYVLVSMVWGLARLAFNVAGSTVLPKAYAKQFAERPDYWLINSAKVLTDGVDFDLVERAINTNDWELARSNYERWVRPFLQQITSSVGLHAGNLRQFDWFVERIRKAELSGTANPLDAWFPGNPIERWIGRRYAVGIGFESFLQSMGVIPSTFQGLVLFDMGGKKTAESDLFAPPPQRPKSRYVRIAARG